MDTVAPVSSFRRRAWLAGALAMALTAVVALVVLARHAPLSAEERMLVGRWYGVIMESDGRECMVLVERYDANRRFSASAFRYDREKTDAGSPWTRSPSRNDDHVSGRWQGAPGAVDVILLDIPGGPTLWKRLETLLKEFRWEGTKTNSVTFELPAIGSTEKRAIVRGLKTEWTAVRVPDDFEAPDEPMPATEVLTWWERKSRSEGR